jgi:O-antigen/teichoic acid export membrane protein
MNALLVAAVGAATNWIQLLFLRRWAHNCADPIAPTNHDDHHEMLRLSKKSFPNAIFFCFQGQITLFILTIFGNPVGIANITALGRLAALLGVFSVTFSSVLAPRFSRCQEPARLRRLYLLLVGGAILVLVPFVLMAWHFPGPLLWLLGKKYQSLGPDCFWVVAAGCVSQLAGIMWSLNSSKAWIRIQAPLFIPVILGVQVLAAACLNLRVFHDVLIFNLAAAVAPLAIYILDAYFGLRQQAQPVRN